jgi:RNA polymerase sigma factor (sigma-70 family)
VRDRHLDVLADETGGIENQILRRELHLLLRQALSELSPEQEWLDRERFFEGCSLQELATEAGTSRQAIHLREQNILRTLRRKLAAALERQPS